MQVRPRVVAFDSIETTFSLASLRPRLEARALPGAVLDLWFARTLRNAFALAAPHARDVHGARCAGLTTAFVARGQPFPTSMAAPDVTGETLAEAAERLLALPAR